jgi:hypothetical protein
MRLSKRGSLASQYQECGLEGVLCIVSVAENTPADGQHHGAMSPKQGCESLLVAQPQEPFKQLNIRKCSLVMEERNPTYVRQHVLHLGLPLLLLSKFAAV